MRLTKIFVFSFFSFLCVSFLSFTISRQIVRNRSEPLGIVIGREARSTDILQFHVSPLSLHIPLQLLASRSRFSSRSGGMVVE